MHYLELCRKYVWKYVIEIYLYFIANACFKILSIIKGTVFVQVLPKVRVGFH